MKKYEYEKIMKKKRKKIWIFLKDKFLCGKYYKGTRVEHTSFSWRMALRDGEGYQWQS